MSNKTTVDIDDPSVRVRLFGGRTAADVAHDYPIYPVDHPALPAPGPNFVAQGISMGDPPTLEGGKKRTTARPTGTWLTALVRSTLYQCDTTVTINREPTLFQPGVTENGSGGYGGRFGPSPCKLMVIGKCLGQAEVENQMPFCGRGSNDLWRAWDEVRIPRPGKELPTFLTNLLPYMPPHAVVQQAIAKGLVADGQHLLWQQFALCRPQVVLLLGADATKAVLGRGATVASYRGRVSTVSADFRMSPDDPPDPWTAEVVVADHPAAVARDPDLYPTFLASMGFLARALGYQKTHEAVPTDYQKVMNLTELERAVTESEIASAHGGYVAFDCEWEGAHPSDDGSYLYTIQWSHAPGHARTVYMRRCGGAPNDGLPLDQAVPILNRLFQKAPQRGARLVAHFAKGDLKWLHSIGVDLYEVYVGPRDDPEYGFDTYYKGAFDVYVAGHAVDETRILKLEVMAAQDFGADRYDVPIDTWKLEYCKHHKMKRSDLKGYGNIPEDTIFEYACKDADYAGREYLLHNGDPRKGTRGLLDSDRFGQSSRKIFGIRMRAWAAMAEMERYGLEVDRVEHRRLSQILVDLYDRKLEELRALIEWPDFDPNKIRHKKELLFGETYSPGGVPIGPQNCNRLNLPPYKATKKSGGRLWHEANARFASDGGFEPEPATDKESLINLSRLDPSVQRLLDLSTIATALKGTFRPPDAPDDGDDEDEPASSSGGVEEDVYSKGLMHYVRGDGRVDTMLGLVETGRYSSSRPNLQNVSESVDEKINKILGWGEFAEKDSPESKLRFVTRSVFRARPGWFLADADLKGAEIATAGWQSGDQLLIEHARRNNLPESDPEWIDLHSDLGAGAFGIQCSYAEFKKKHKPLRVAAKRARFGHYYGASPETIHRQCLLDSPDVTLEQVERIVRGHDEKYPTLAKYFGAARKRVGKGWLRNGYGGMRRFRPSDARDLLAAQERAGQNWTCQGEVADHISDALGKLWYAIRDMGLKSRIVLAIHDSIVCECPPDEIEYVVDVLLPWVMGKGTPLIPTTLDGIPTGKGPFEFGVSCKVNRIWGISLADEEWRTVVEQVGTDG